MTAMRRNSEIRVVISWKVCHSAYDLLGIHLSYKTRNDFLPECEISRTVYMPLDCTFIPCFANADSYLWRRLAVGKQALYAENISRYLTRTSSLTSTAIRVGTPARCIPDHIKTKKGLKFIEEVSFLHSYNCRDARLFRETWGFDLLK